MSHHQEETMTGPEQTVEQATSQTLVDEELVLEEISIDGMCGVY